MPLPFDAGRRRREVAWRVSIIESIVCMVVKRVGDGQQWTVAIVVDDRWSTIDFERRKAVNMRRSVEVRSLILKPRSVFPSSLYSSSRLRPAGDQLPLGTGSSPTSHSPPGLTSQPCHRDHRLAHGPPIEPLFHPRIVLLHTARRRLCRGPI
jgi:hypothetical protein